MEQRDASTPENGEASVLVVWPPMAGPAALFSRMPGGSAALAAAGTPAEVFDANRAFYERLLLSGEKGRPLSDRPGAEDQGALEALARMLDGRLPHVAEAGRLVPLFRERMARAAAAFSPTQMGWGWIRCPTLRGPDDVAAFVRDRDVNPFLPLAEEAFAPLISGGSRKAVAFRVLSPVQCPAALTLADACRRAAPGLVRVLVAPAVLAADMAPFFDRTVDADRLQDKGDVFGTENSRRPGRRFLYPLPAEPMQERETRVIRWRIDTAAAFPQAEEIKKTARAGAWNHLDVFGSGAETDDPASAYPAAHSFCRWEPARFAPAGARPRWPARVDGYRGVPPLAGIPLWCAVKDPDLIDAWLLHTTTAELRRWRIEENDGAAFRLGDDLSFRFVAPAELSADEMDEVCSMVIAGGSVGTRWVRHNLERAYLIGIVEERGVIVANSSLKHPREEYIEKVSTSAGIDLSGFLERGYTSVRPEYRGLGIGTRLLEGLTARARGYRIFSIISEDNAATQKIAIRNRTKKVVTFYSRALEKQVGLWMPEATADEFLKDRKGP